MLEREVLGDLMSKNLPLLFRSQSYGERALNGERMEEVALSGPSTGENAGDCGIRRRMLRADAGAEVGWANGDGKVADVGDLRLSQLHEQELSSLVAEDGAEVGVYLPDCLSPFMGLAMLLRKSV
jgi:hypothetical protein